MGNVDEEYIQQLVKQGAQKLELLLDDLEVLDPGMRMYAERCKLRGCDIRYVTEPFLDGSTYKIWLWYIPRS